MPWAAFSYKGKWRTIGWGCMNLKLMGKPQVFTHLCAWIQEKNMTKLFKWRKGVQTKISTQPTKQMKTYHCEWCLGCCILRKFLSERLILTPDSSELNSLEETQEQVHLRGPLIPAIIARRHRYLSYILCYICHPHTDSWDTLEPLKWH